MNKEKIRYLKSKIREYESKDDPLYKEAIRKLKAELEKELRS